MARGSGAPFLTLEGSTAPGWLVPAPHGGCPWSPLRQPPLPGATPSPAARARPGDSVAPRGSELASPRTSASGSPSLGAGPRNLCPAPARCGCGREGRVVRVSGRPAGGRPAPCAESPPSGPRARASDAEWTSGTLLCRARGLPVRARGRPRPACQSRAPRGGCVRPPSSRGWQATRPHLLSWQAAVAAVGAGSLTLLASASSLTSCMLP